MPHLSYKEFKNKFGDLGITEWVKYNWIGWSQDKTGYYLRKHLSETAEIAFDDIDVVDLGTLEWEYQSEYSRFKAPLPELRIANIRTLDFNCLLYNTSYAPSISEVADKSVYNGSNDAVIYIHDSSYTNATIFKSAMSGVLLAYLIS